MKSSSKKQACRDTDKWVYGVCFDDPLNPVMIDTTLLTTYNCRMGKKIRYDAPDATVDGLPAWHVNIGRSMFVAFLKGLSMGEFIVPRDGTYDEAIKLFEYEGIAVPGMNRSHRTPHFAAVHCNCVARVHARSCDPSPNLP